MPIRTASAAGRGEPARHSAGGGTGSLAPAQPPASARFAALGSLAVVSTSDAAALAEASELLAYELAQVDAVASRFRLDSEVWRLAGRRQAARGRANYAHVDGARRLRGGGS